MIHKLLFKRPDLHAVNSLRELKTAKVNVERFDKTDEVRKQALDIVDSCRYWTDVAARYNQTNVDCAAHDDKLAVLDAVDCPCGDGKTTWFAKVTGEIKFDEDADTVKNAKFSVDDTDFSYRKPADREVFVQTEKGVRTTVTLDHAKNTLTWEY